MKGAARLFALSSLSVGANPTAVQMELHKNYGVVMKAKDLQNIKQAQTGMLIIMSIICLPTRYVLYI